MAWTPFPDKNNDHPVQLPNCFALCDGSEIIEGIWAGHTTPDINKSRRFLRGGIVTNALNLEEDSLQDHTHESRLNDPGHAHRYDDKYFQDHVNGFPSWAFEDYADERLDQSHDSISAYATTGITMSVNGVSGIGARISSETKPKNMNVVYIMKVC